MSYYSRQKRGATSPNAKPKRLLPEQLHDVFRIEMNRLNNNREIVEQGLLFDSDIERTSKRNKDHLGTKSSKFTLSSVYIGEIFRFRIKISNKLNESLHNFGLLCHVQMNVKGNGPTQLYPRPRELCPTQMSKNDNVSIDLEYPVTANEPSTYELILTVTASNEDDMQQLYKNIFEFRAVPCVSLTYQKQTLDENLYCEALCSNVSNQPKMPLFVDVNFKCMGLFKSFNLTDHNQLLLEPQSEKNVLFQIEMKNPTSLVNLNALSVGQIEIKWQSKDKARAGIFLSDIIQRRSLFCRKIEASANNKNNNNKSSVSDNIEILILKCPSSYIVHKSFTVTFHVFNLDRHAHKVWISIDKMLSGYLAPCNISKKYLGILEPSTSIKTDMSLIAFAPGIHVLTGIVIHTQRLNSISSLSSPKNGKLQNANTKSIQYESTQYIYIDISEEFHQQKMKEKRDLELKQLEMQKKQKENEQDMDEVDMNNGDDEKEGVIDDDNIGIEQQMKHRGSMELNVNMNETMNLDQNENKEDEEEVEEKSEIESAPKQKLALPPSSEMKPIGQLKSEQQIMKEMIEEEQAENKSLNPLASTEIEEDENEENEEKLNNEVAPNETVNSDDLDVPPLEIEQNEDEQTQVQNDENELQLPGGDDEMISDDPQTQTFSSNETTIEESNDVN